MEATSDGSVWIIDLVAVLFIGWYVVIGWRLGLVRSLILIGGLVLAIYCGARFAPSVASRLGTALPSDVRYGVAFLVLFAVVMIAFSYLARLVGKAMAAGPLSFIDHMGGAAFGALKALLYLAVIAVVLAMLPVPSTWTSLYLGSRIVRTSVNVGGAVVRVIRPHVSEPLRDFIDEAEAYFRDRAMEASEQAIREKRRI